MNYSNRINLIKRIDIIIRVLYIKSFLSWANFTKYRKLYRKSIKVSTWWVEWNKRSEDEFEERFQSLIYKIKNDWYNWKFPIEINQAWDLINWWHRLACCLFFNITPKITIVEEIGNVQNVSYLSKHWFTNEEIITIMKTYTKYFDKYNVYIIWPTLQHKAKELKSEIEKKWNLIWSFHLKYTSKSINEIVQDIYCFDSEVLQTSYYNIMKKISILSKAKNKSIEVCIFSRKKDYNEREFKERLRNKYKKYIHANNWDEKFYTFHSWDWLDENSYLRKLFLSYSNISSFSYRKIFQNSDKLINRIKKLDLYCLRNGIKKENVCIVWSTVMEINWLRQASDLDVILTNSVSLEFKDTSEVIIHEKHQYDSQSSNTQLIKHANTFFRWYKYLNLKIYYDIKLRKNRKKDINDIVLLNKFLMKRKRKKNFIAEIKFRYYYYKKYIYVHFFLFMTYVTQKLWIYQKVSKIRRKYFLKKE